MHGGGDYNAHATGYADNTSGHEHMSDDAAGGATAARDYSRSSIRLEQYQQHVHYEQQHGAAGYYERTPSPDSYAQSDEDRFDQPSRAYQSYRERHDEFDGRSRPHRDSRDAHYSEQHASHHYHHHHQQQETPHMQIRDAPPSRTLIMRGLTPAVSERMIMTALAVFRPTHARVIQNKTTGESRGFAFVMFQSIPDATQVVRAYTHGPLQLDGHPVALGYADNSRLNTSAAVPAAAGGNGDWFCTRCHGTNFARRDTCFKCDGPRDEFGQEPPRDWQHQQQGYQQDQQGYQQHGDARYHGVEDSDVDSPSTVLLVRMLPDDIEEGELHVAFAEFEGVKDIRLIRDRATNLPRGFGFVEFVDLESARAALEASNSIRVHGQEVQVSFARDASQQQLKHSTHGAYAAGANHAAYAANSIAAAALEQAQWSLANGYGGGAAAAGTAAATTAQQQHESRSHSDLDADIDAFLSTAVAGAGAPPPPPRPKKQWPLTFETGGGSYVFASDLGLYWDPDSAFYYDPQSKLYYSSFTGQYFQCHDGSKGALATFQIFVPPPPPDNVVFTAVGSTTAAAAPTTSATGGAAALGKGVMLSLAKKKEKKPAIAFGVLAPLASKAKEPMSSGAQAAPSAVSAASSSLKRKSAVDIAKWSQLQRASKAGESSSEAAEEALAPPKSTASSAPLPTKSNAELDKLVNGVVAAEAPICLLCRRKFASMEQLRKHETLSKLHLENLAKAKAHKDAIASQYRELEKERKDRDESQQQQQRKRQRGASPAQSTTVSAAPVGVSASSNEPTVAAAVDSSASLESSIGGKMLKMMGWKSGEGLGKHGTGITAPVVAVGNVGNDTAGIGARSNAPPPIDLSDMASYKERLQQIARARYDATPRGL